MEFTIGWLCAISRQQPTDSYLQNFLPHTHISLWKTVQSSSVNKYLGIVANSILRPCIKWNYMSSYKSRLLGRLRDKYKANSIWYHNCWWENIRLECVVIIGWTVSYMPHTLCRRYVTKKHHITIYVKLALVLQIHNQVGQIVLKSWHPSVHVHFQYCFVQIFFVVFASEWYGLGLCEIHTLSLCMVVTILLSLCTEQILELISYT